MTTPPVEAKPPQTPTVEQCVEWLSDYIGSFDPFMDKHMHDYLSSILSHLRAAPLAGLTEERLRAAIKHCITELEKYCTTRAGRGSLLPCAVLEKLRTATAK